MSQKEFYFKDIGNIKFYKRRNSKSIRIRVNGNTVKVTLPYWLPYKAAVGFVNKRMAWILQNTQNNSFFFDNSIIGQNYKLNLQHSSSKKFNMKEIDDTIKISVPSYLALDSETVQNRIEKYIINILKRDAEDNLIPLARNIAESNKFELNSLEIKKLKSRWGSCNSKKDIVLNLYLIQLPNSHIEYVIFHELAHTVFLNHSKEFWNLVENFIPEYKKIRKDIKSHSPDILISRP